MAKKKKKKKKKDYERDVIVSRDGSVRYLPKMRRSKKNPIKAFEKYLQKLADLGHFDD